MEKNDILTKAFTFFRTAVKKFDEGDIEGALSDIQWGTKAVEENEAEGLDAPNEDEIMGESRNFGKIYKIIEENAEKLYTTESGRKTLGKVAKLIRENKVLNEQFKAYTAFSTMSTDINVDNYIAEAMQFIPEFTRKELKENNQKLADIVKEAKMDMKVFISNDENRLFEAVEYILSNKKALNNLDKFQLAEGTIKEHIISNIANNTLNENKDINTIYENSINALERKYYGTLNDDEVSFMRKMLDENVDKKKYFNDYKSALIRKLKRLVNESNGTDKDAWKNVMESINVMTDEDNMLIENIAKMIEIENKIDE